MQIIDNARTHMYPKKSTKAWPLPAVIQLILRTGDQTDEQRQKNEQYYNTYPEGFKRQTKRDTESKGESGVSCWPWFLGTKECLTDPNAA